MVNKDLDLVDHLTFADAHESYPEAEKEEIYDEIFYEAGFAEPDLVLLTGAPSKAEEEQRREVFIEYLNEFNGQMEKIPYLLTTSSHIEALLEDERVDESDYILHPMVSDSSLDEIEALKEDVGEEEKIAVVTNDYHVPRYEKRLNAALSEDWNDPRDSWFSTAQEFFLDPEYGEETNDYIVFGAEFSEDEFDELDFEVRKDQSWTTRWFPTSENYGDKWNSETIRTVLPQKLKDVGKNYHPSF